MALLATACLVSGCLRIPVKAKPVTEGQGGENTVADPSTIRPGTSTRQEILRDWGWCDTHVNSDRLFVGRVRRSNSKEVQTFYAVPLNSSRDWHVDYLFVEFNDESIVSKTNFVPGSHLAREVLVWSGDVAQTHLDITRPIEIKSLARMKMSNSDTAPAHWQSYQLIILHPDSLELRPADAKETAVHVGVAQLRNVHACGHGSTESENFVCLGVVEAQRRIGNMRFSLDAPGVVILARWLNQVAPSALRSPAINSMSQFLDHLANDAIPALLNRLSTESKEANLETARP